MSIEVIPNQPINLAFTERDSCLPTDNRKYCASYQYGDYIKVQMKTAGAGYSNCNPTFVRAGTELITNSRFTTDLSDWTTSSTTWNSGGGAHMAFVGVGVTKTMVQSGISFSSFSGRLILKLTVKSITGDCDITPDLDGAPATSLNITSSGVYYFPMYYAAIPATLTISVESKSASLDIVFSEVSITDSFDCILGADTGWDFIDGGLTHQTGNTTVAYLLSTGYTGASPYYGVYVNVSDMTAGTLGVYLDGSLLGTISADGVYKYFATATATSNCELHPSSDFDGTVTYFDCVEYDSSIAVNLTALDGTPYLDLVTNGSVTYEQDRITISVLCGDDANAVQQGCYVLEITGTYPSAFDYVSNCIQVNETMTCGKKIEGYGDDGTRSFGFLWGAFRLTHRVEFLKFNPEYPIDSDDYEFSDGSRALTFAKREKYYTGRINYVDETIHDTISTQILCKTFTVDGERYFVKPQNYKPSWEKDGNNNVAQANIELRKYQSTIYSNNQ